MDKDSMCKSDTAESYVAGALVHSTIGARTQALSIWDNVRFLRKDVEQTLAFGVMAKTEPEINQGRGPHHSEHEPLDHW